MRAKYVWRDGEWVDVHTLGPRQAPGGPFIMSDTPAYMSPLGTGLIDGRAARREDLKRGGCREVDPSENPSPVYRNPRFAKKHGLQLGGDPLPAPVRLPTTIGPVQVRE